MADLHGATPKYRPPSPRHQEPDEMSLLLQQILVRSSPSPFMQQETASGLGPSIAAANASSSAPVGNLDYELDCEYDYESEEAVEAYAGEPTAPSPARPRNSSKRSRAAEVHNLSEKRRRSRINEKMKALQNLIPNSNKTDKASMLDEAIEYLKQLQLQVQMLTLRNGLGLYPICLPAGMMFQPHRNLDLRMDAPEYRDLNAGLLGIQQNCVVNQSVVTDFSAMMDSKFPLELELSVQDHLGPFQAPVYQEKMLHYCKSRLSAD